MKFYTRHFLIIINYFYNYPILKIFFKKKKLFYSFTRNYIKKNIFKIFNKLKLNIYGYKIIIILNISFNFNKYFKFLKYNFFLLCFEIICFFNKIFFFLK